jgi:hypothetical protein
VAAVYRAVGKADKVELWEVAMKFSLGGLILVIISGCATLKPVELAPEQLHEKIFSGNVVQEGDNIRVITSDGMRHKFKVKAITKDHIVGKDINIPISDLVALETSEFSGGKTTLLVGGTFVWMYIILLSIPAIVVL